MNLIKALCAHTSSDQTRYHLNGVHYDGERFTATDGHRLLTCKADEYAFAVHIPRVQLSPGDILETKAFKAGGVLKIDGKYPNYKQLIPSRDNTKWIFKTRMAPWLEGMKAKRADQVPCGIDERGEFSTGPGCIAYVNLAYLAPFAGEHVWIYIANDIAPILIEPDTGAVTKDPLWQAVVMPMRRGDKAELPTVIKRPDTANVTPLKVMP